MTRSASLAARSPPRLSRCRLVFAGGGLHWAAPNIDIVDAVGDGQRAVRSAVELAPDIVVMDLNLPGISGMEAIRRILGMTPVRASWCSDGRRRHCGDRGSACRRAATC